MIELKIDSVREKIIYKLFGKSILSRIELEKIKNDYNMYILNFPKDLKLLPKNNTNIILVQHINYEKYIKEYFQNNLKLIEECKKRLKYFVFLSEYDRERFIKELNFPRKKTKVIRHSCELELRDEPKMKNKKLIMICRISNIQKRIDLAIRVMKKLPDFILEIYGTGPDEEMLNNLIKQEKLEDNIFLMGATNKIQERLDECSIFIMTSDYEGYPITSVEAMRRGLPIVLRNTFDSAQDIIENNGILLEEEWNEDKFVEAVRKIYNNYEFYSKNAVEMGKKYDFEVIKPQWEELIVELSN